MNATTGGDQTKADLEDGVGLSTSAYSWNPIYQKPQRLGMDGIPGGGYHYYGPPPDVGTTYGSWWDETNAIGVLAPVPDDGVTVYSPLSGEQMTYEGVASPDMREAILGFQGELHLMPASSTGQTCLTSAPIFGAECNCPAMHSPFSGEDVTEEYTIMSGQKKAAATKAAPKAPATAASKSSKTKAPAGMPELPNSVTVPKMENTGLPPQAKSADPIDPKGVDKGKDKLGKETGPGGSEDDGKMSVEKMANIKPVGDVVQPGSSAKAAVDAMSDTELCEAIEAHLSIAEGEDSMSAPPSSEEAPPPPPAPEGSELPEPPPAEGEGAQCPVCNEQPCTCLPAEQPAEQPVSPEGSELPEPPPAESGSDIPVIDMGMPNMPMARTQAAFVKQLRTVAAALRAGQTVPENVLRPLMAKAVKVLRAKAAAEAEGQPFDQFLKDRVSEDVAGSDVKAEVRALRRDLKAVTEALKSLVGAQQKPAVVKAEEAPPAPPAQEGEEEKKVEDLMSDQAAGVSFEVLQSLDQLEEQGSVTSAEVDMQLYAEGSANPFWNVSVKGNPTARIMLQDQDRPEEIRALFCSPIYAESIGKAAEVVKGGIRKVLADAKARYFALQIDHADVAQRATAAATAEADAVVKAKIAEVADSFLECMATAAIGLDKNFFPIEDGGNPLKASLVDVMTDRGISVADAVAIVESGFQASPLYFKALAAKAIELQSMEKTAFEQLRNSIIKAGVVAPVMDAAPATADTDIAPADASQSFASYLAQTSNPVQAGFYGADRSEDPKARLRSEIGFGKRNN